MQHSPAQSPVKLLHSEVNNKKLCSSLIEKFHGTQLRTIGKAVNNYRQPIKTYVYKDIAPLSVMIA